MLANKLVLDKEWPKGADIEAIVEELPDTECRYVFIDFNTVTEDKRKVAKTVLVAWTPNGAQMKEKFAYSSSKGAVLGTLKGVQLEIVADRKAEVG